MNDLEIGIIGFISGSIAGAFFALIAIIYLYMYSQDKTVEDIEPVHVIYEFMNIYYQESETVFAISFILGFLSSTSLFARSSSN